MTGRPPFKPTPFERNLVTRLAREKTPERKIVASIRRGINPGTLHKYFKEEINAARNEIKTAVNKPPVPRRTSEKSFPKGIPYQASERDRAIVRTMADAKISREKIADAICVSESTLYRHFAEEIGKGGKSGNKTFCPSEGERRQVKMLSKYGLSNKQIADAVRGGIKPSTLVKYFSDELSSGRIATNYKVGRKLYEMAMEGNTQAAIWWTKARMGWNDRGLMEDAGDKAQESTQTIQLVGFSPNSKELDLLQGEDKQGEGQESLH